MEAKYYTRQNLIAALIVGIMLGAGAYYLWDNKAALKIKKDAVSSKKTINEETTGENMMPIDEGTQEMIFEESANTVSTPDQPAGYRVILNSVTIAESGW